MFRAFKLEIRTLYEYIRQGIVLFCFKLQVSCFFVSYSYFLLSLSDVSLLLNKINNLYCKICRKIVFVSSQFYFHIWFGISEPGILKEVKQKLDLGSVKFEVWQYFFSFKSVLDFFLICVPFTVVVFCS